MTRGHFWISCIIWGLSVDVGDTLFRTMCHREGSFEVVHENARLINYVISTRDVHSLLHCMMACMNEQQCSSYNFQISGNPLHRCELNNNSQSSARSGSLVLADGYQYYETVPDLEVYNPCEDDPCLNGGKCEESCVEFPHIRCVCPEGFAGRHCEKLKRGNFLLQYSSNNVSERVPVLTHRGGISYISSCVFFKPNTSSGTVFTYATEESLMEMALLFNQSNVEIYILDTVITVKLTIPVQRWSHICFTSSRGRKFSFYYNGQRVYQAVNISEKYAMKGVGAIVLGAQQISLGKVDLNSASNMVLSRLYLWYSVIPDVSIIRLLNEPYVPEIKRKAMFVDWRWFYRPQLSFNTTVIYPTNEPRLGNYDLSFSGHQQPVNVTLGVVKSGVEAFTLCMWLKANLSKDIVSTVFVLKSSLGIVMKLRLTWNNFCEFTLTNQTWSFDVCPNNARWYHLCVVWYSGKGILEVYVDGLRRRSQSNVDHNQILPEISNGTVQFGGSTFVGGITGVNIWLRKFDHKIIACLAIRPGNAEGDLLQWSMIKRENNLIDDKKFTSAFRKDWDDFDLNFPPLAENVSNYIHLESSYTDYGSVFHINFWIKIPGDYLPFTLISYAVPDQLNEINIHFGTNGIWLHADGEKRFIPLHREEFIGTWNFFTFRLDKGGFVCWHNAKLILADKGLKKRKIQWKDGVLVIGAQQTQYKVISNKVHKFYGQLSQLQIFKASLNYELVRTLAVRCSSFPGNRFRWSDIPAGIKGNIEKVHPSHCLKQKDGEEDLN